MSHEDRNKIFSGDTDRGLTNSRFTEDDSRDIEGMFKSPRRKDSSSKRKGSYKGRKYSKSSKSKKRDRMQMIKDYLFRNKTQLGNILQLATIHQLLLAMEN